MSTQVRVGLIAVGGVGVLLAAGMLVTKAHLRRSSICEEAVRPAEPPRPIAMLPTEPPSSLWMWSRAETPSTSDVPEPKPARKLPERSEEELRRQILGTPAVALDLTDDRAESRDAIRPEAPLTLTLLDRRADLAGLPIRRNHACEQTPAAAIHLARDAGDLKSWAINPIGLAQKLTARKGKDDAWLKAAIVPTLVQVLTAESAEVREILASHLGRIDAPEATRALVRLALFDLSPRVRELARAGLGKRPAKDYRPHLLQGFDHPWPVIAENAATALVALRRTDARPALEALMTRPDPRAPYEKSRRKTLYVKELVRVHHLTNCLLCHPPSIDARDPVRGVVPAIDQPIVTGPAYYHSPSGRKAIFVRADITYLEQDFSAMLPVERPGLGSPEQRYDFFVRERAATARDIEADEARKKAGPTSRRRAILFALDALADSRAAKPIARR